MEYMERHYPVVQIGENNVKIAYSLGRGEEDNGWTCEKVDLIKSISGHWFNVSVHWLIFPGEKLVIGVDFLEVVLLSQESDF